MKTLSRSFAVAIAMLLAAGAAAAQKQQRPQPCFDKTQTQQKMNAWAKQELDAADRELNQTYDAIRKKYAERSKFLDRLQEAERAWLKFRDAQLEMKYGLSSERDPGEPYGSAWPMCYALEKAEMTRQRVKELRVWLTGLGEGEVCTGSIQP